jgi:ABC-type uncharacterized transport system substrate-binding protein
LRRIGVLISVAEADPEGQRWVQALLQGLQESGWKRGTNLEIDLRYGDSNNERMRTIAKELVAAQPEVLQVTSTPGTAAVLALAVLRLIASSYLVGACTGRSLPRLHPTRINTDMAAR